METSSPPITPIRPHMSPLDTSPTSTYRPHSSGSGYGGLSRRTSSFSSNHDRSPVSLRSNRHRFSDGSMYSNQEFGADGGGGGMGNLADELDMIGDFEEEDGGEVEGADGRDGEVEGAHGVDGARDSGIDVSYEHKRVPATGRLRRNSKPLGSPAKPPEAAGQEEEDDEEEKLPRDLEDLLSAVARMSSNASTTTSDPLIPRFTALLNDLGNQSHLETSTHRLTTSTNSLTTHLTTQSKTLQTLLSTLYSPLALLTHPLPPSFAAETLPYIDTLLPSLPHPDPAPLQALQKLHRDTAALAHTLSQLTDTLQMGKHVTNAAARHLRDSQRMVAGMRRERERAEEARALLREGGWEGRVRDRWCRRECGEVVSGFERACEELRGEILRGAAA